MRRGEMRVNLETELQHRLLLTPKQQLFLTFIGMPYSELSEFIKKQVEINPFLEFEQGRAEGFPEQDVTDDEVHLDRLTEQLRLSTDSEETIKIGEYIIDNLDDDGYFRKPLSEVAAELKTSVKKVEEALKIVQSLEPAGLGARDLRECLLLQIERYLGKKQAIYLIVRDCWQELVKREHQKIGRRLHLGTADIGKETEKLKKFQSAPLKGIFKRSARRIIPEGKVIREEGRFRVHVDERIYPFLKINSVYEREFRNPSMSAREKAFLERQLKQARIVLKILGERQQFLTDVFQEIVEYQKDYLEGGILLPLREKDIADRKEVSISTVSRAVNRKYLDTPSGLLKIRDLFSGTVGDSISKHFVVDRIREIVGREKKSLSDREIVRKLADGGVTISVRTVNKYRHQEGILNSYLRVASQPLRAGR